VNIHCIENFFTVHDFWATCACPEKNIVALKIFTVVNILFIFRIYINLRLPWKQRFPRNFSLYWIYFLHSGVLSNLRLPWKTEFVLNSQYWIYIFYYSGFLSNLCCPRIFHCIEIYFIIQDFWATSACPEKQSCPENFHCMEYTFYIQNFWATLWLPWKTELALNFSLYWICIFYHSGFLSNLRLPWKTELP